MFVGPSPPHNFPAGSDGKASAYSLGDPGLIPGWGRSPGEGNGTLLQYSCLENPMDGGAWWAAVHGFTKSRTWLNDFTFFLVFLLHMYLSPSVERGECHGLREFTSWILAASVCTSQLYHSVAAWSYVISWTLPGCSFHTPAVALKTL